MFEVAKSSVLVVGIECKAALLRELDIDVVSFEFGAQAVQSLRTENIQGIISRWDLPDMKNGKLLKGVKLIKPYLPTVALTDPGNSIQEINARSIGVSAVLTDDSDGYDFQRLVCNLMGFERIEVVNERLTVIGK
jgi:DNA-binding NarL/FixJ family response regulator